MARILLVDDEQDVLAMLRDGLQLRGHQVDAASSADEAIVLEGTRTHDLAVIDYVLPGTRGLHLLRKLQHMNPAMRSIMISGQIDHDELEPPEVERELHTHVAVDAYLPKPVPLDQLAATIDRLLAPIVRGEVDWKAIAEGVTRVKGVKEKNVKALDRALHKRRKKRR